MNEQKLSQRTHRLRWGVGLVVIAGLCVSGCAGPELKVVSTSTPGAEAKSQPEAGAQKQDKADICAKVMADLREGDQKVSALTQAQDSDPDKMSAVFESLRTKLNADIEGSAVAEVVTAAQQVTAAIQVPMEAKKNGNAMSPETIKSWQNDMNAAVVNINKVCAAS